MAENLDSCSTQRFSHVIEEMYAFRTITMNFIRVEKATCLPFEGGAHSDQPPPLLWWISPAPLFPVLFPSLPCWETYGRVRGRTQVNSSLSPGGVSEDLRWWAQGRQNGCWVVVRSIIVTSLLCDPGVCVSLNRRKKLPVQVTALPICSLLLFCDYIMTGCADTGCSTGDGRCIISGTLGCGGILRCGMGQGGGYTDQQEFCGLFLLRCPEHLVHTRCELDQLHVSHWMWSLSSVTVGSRTISDITKTVGRGWRKTQPNPTSHSKLSPTCFYILCRVLVQCKELKFSAAIHSVASDI